MKITYIRRNLTLLLFVVLIMTSIFARGTVPTFIYASTVDDLANDSDGFYILSATMVVQRPAKLDPGRGSDDLPVSWKFDGDYGYGARSEGRPCDFSFTVTLLGY